MIRLVCKKGFSLCEAAFSLMTSISIALFFTGLLYTSLARLWLDQITYDAVICIAESRPRSRCEQALLKKARWAGAQVLKSKWSIEALSWGLKVDWQLPKDVRLSSHKHIEQRSFR